MPDPRIIRTPAFGAEGPLQTTRTLTEEEQLRTLTMLMNDLYRASLPTDDPLYLSLPPNALDSAGARLEEWAQYAPDLLNQVRDTLSAQYGFEPTSGVGGDAAAAEIFNRIVGASSRSQERRTTTGTQTTETAQGITRRGREEFERTTGRQVTRYVDIPTPDEFLDEFQNSLATFVRGLRGAGTINQSVADFLMQNPDTLLDSYLADLGARAARGEDIFRVVGIDGGVERLGARPGEAVSEQFSGWNREQIHEQISTTQRDRITEEVRRQFSEQAGQTTEGGATLPFTTEQEQQISEETDRRLNEITNRLVNEQIEQTGRETLLTEEIVLGRPRLTTVFKISPLSFLQSQYSPRSLENLAVGRGGVRQAQAQAARGVVPSATRRVQ